MASLLSLFSFLDIGAHAEDRGAMLPSYSARFENRGVVVTEQREEKDFRRFLAVMLQLRSAHQPGTRIFFTPNGQ